MKEGTRRSSGEARRITIRGRVQGVWFRDSTRREAERLGVTGYAINRPNGDVEVLACGMPEALDALCTWLRQGPPMAKVTDVEQTGADYQELEGFTTG